MPSGTLVTARGSMLYTLRPGTDAAWVDAGDLARFGIDGVSRLAVSPDDSKGGRIGRVWPYSRAQPAFKSLRAPRT
jgi:hypothetical protein